MSLRRRRCEGGEKNLSFIYLFIIMKPVESVIKVEVQGGSRRFAMTHAIKGSHCLLLYGVLAMMVPVG